MFNMFSEDAEQQALSFLVSQTTYIETAVYKMQYPELDYASLVPVDTSAPDWAKSVTFFSTDMVGQAQWFNHLATDIPIADISRNKHETGIEMAGIGYQYTLEELGQAQMVPNLNLTTDRAAAARRAYEEFMYYNVLYGSSVKAWEGLINNQDVPVITVAHTWAYDVAQSTPLIAALMNDVNNVLVNVWMQSMTVEMADTLLMPLSSLSLLAMTQMPATNMNLMQWLKQNNVYTATTGQPLTIRAVRGLDTAGQGGTARIIAYRRSMDVLKVHIPMPHRFLNARQTGPLLYQVPGIFRTAGTEIRRPGAVRYIDGV